MHRAVLQNKAYIKYSKQYTVEVIAMEETDRAVEAKSTHVRTYTVKDAYGDEVKMLVEFPGLTLEQIQDLSNGAAIDFMEGGKIPYTAIVNPHNLKEMQAFKGTRTANDLIDAIKKHVTVLKRKYGEGVDRGLWNRVSEGEVQVDMKLAGGDIVGALEVWKHFAPMTARQHEALKNRVTAMKTSALEDAAKRLDAIAKLIADGKGRKVKRELRQLSRALSDTALAARANELAAKLPTNKK